MTTQDMATAVLWGYLAFLALAFGLRSVVHYRRTGTTGFVGLSGQPGSPEWWGGVLFIVALAAGLAAPLFQLMGVVTVYAPLEVGWARALGGFLYLAGVAGTLWAQFTMGDSWRIGVDASERTTLVAAGPFRWIRNPIFTAMSTASVGLALMVPNVFALLAVIILAIGLEIHVRLVEEPYLTRTHGEQYRRYAASAGRFLPGLGRLEGSR